MQQMFNKCLLNAFTFSLLSFITKDPHFQNSSLSYSPRLGLYQQALGFSRPMLNLQYLTSSHSTTCRNRKKMALTQCLWCLFPTHESRTPIRVPPPGFPLGKSLTLSDPYTPPLQSRCLSSYTDRALGLYHHVLLQLF